MHTFVERLAKRAKEAPGVVTYQDEVDITVIEVYSDVTWCGDATKNHPDFYVLAQCCDTDYEFYAFLRYQPSVVYPDRLDRTLISATTQTTICTSQHTLNRLVRFRTMSEDPLQLATRDDIFIPIATEIRVKSLGQTAPVPNYKPFDQLLKSTMATVCDDGVTNTEGVPMRIRAGPKRLPKLRVKQRQEKCILPKYH